MKLNKIPHLRNLVIGNRSLKNKKINKKFKLHRYDTRNLNHNNLNSTIIYMIKFHFQ